MIVNFDTSDPVEARRRLDAVGGTNVAQRDFIAQCVADGLIRVGDPLMYGDAPIRTTERCLPAQGKAIVERFTELAEEAGHAS